MGETTAPERHLVGTTGTLATKTCADLDVSSVWFRSRGREASSQQGTEEGVRVRTRAHSHSVFTTLPYLLIVNILLVISVSPDMLRPQSVMIEM